MNTYFNDLTQETESIDKAIDFYITPSEDGQYVFVVSPTDVNTCQNCPITNAKEFWTISRQHVNANLAVLFPNNIMRNDLLTIDEVQEYFGFFPDNTQANKFGLLEKELQSLSLAQILEYLNPNNTDILKKRAAMLNIAGQADDDSNQINNSIRTIVSLLGSTDEFTRRYATVACVYLARNPEYYAAFQETNTIAQLISLVAITDDITRQNAILALATLLDSIENHKDFRDLGGIEKLVAVFECDDDATKLYATEVLKILTFNIENHKDLRDADCIALFIALLESDDEEAKQDAIAALANMAVNVNNHDVFQKANGISQLSVKLESTDDDNVINPALTLCLANLAKNQATHDDIRKANGIEPLVARLKSSNTLVKQYAVGALFNLTQNSENDDVLRTAEVIFLLFGLCISPDDITKQNAISALAQLGAREVNGIEQWLELLKSPTDTQQHSPPSLANLDITRAATSIAPQATMFNLPEQAETDIHQAANQNMQSKKV